MSDSACCASCARRCWLLGELSGPLERCALDRSRLIDALALADAELIAALGGSRRERLSASHRAFTVSRSPAQSGATTQAATTTERVCRHDDGYPAGLRARGAPAALDVLGGAARLGSLTQRPAVAVLGGERASDYGAQTARELARGLALSGVTVVTALAGGVSASAQRGVLDAGAGSVAVFGHGLGVAPPVSLTGLAERIAARGCVVSELPCGLDARRWGTIAASRTVVGLASVVAVVEARDTPGELFAARLARARLGSDALAAVPGRVSSPLAAGPNALLRDGARLVRGAEDVLELLGGFGPADARATIERAADCGTRAARVLELVSSGWDTVERLATVEGDGGETLAALAELETRGLLARGAGGRYVPRHRAARSASTEI